MQMLFGLIGLKKLNIFSLELNLNQNNHRFYI